MDHHLHLVRRGQLDEGLEVIERRMHAAIREQAEEVEATPWHLVAERLAVGLRAVLRLDDRVRDDGMLDIEGDGAEWGQVDLYLVRSQLQ